MDPSRASINANQPEQQPEQTETIICMDLKYYNAAIEGKIEVFKDIVDPKSLELLLTPIKNTILHIYITALNSGSKSTTSNARSESTTALNARSESRTNFVEEILKMCPSLLRKPNVKSEIPLHIAARYGHDDIVDALIKNCGQTLHRQDLEGGIDVVKEILMMKNKEGDTALHEAVRYNHLKVVKLLIKEDPYFLYSANDAGETPLYIAAERRFKEVLFEILDKCKSPMHVGPLGRTALHAAVIQKNDAGMTEIILDKIKGISRKVDNNGWTPLHFAAYFDHSDLTKLLLNKDREVAYMKDTKGRTALHIAAQRGSTSAMESIVSKYPDCYELVDNRGWNVLHFAMKGDNQLLQRAIEIIIEKPFLGNLLNEKNADGDTPLHFYSSSLKSANNFFSHPQVDKMAFNKQNLSAYDVALTNAKLPRKKKLQIMNAIDPPPRRVITYEDEDKKNKDGDKDNDEDEDDDKKNEDNISMLQKAAEALLVVAEDKKKEDETSSLLQKAAETHLVVAALITTVTFAACITMPGGFVGVGEGSHPDPGSALLRRNAAFKAFVITDTISMVLSSSAVFLHLLMPFLFDDGDEDKDEEKREKILLLAFRFILWAMVAMGLAFVTGTYAVLVPSLDLGIANCIIGLTFFATLIFGFRKFIDFSFLEILKFFLFLDY